MNTYITKDKAKLVAQLGPKPWDLRTLSRDDLGYLGDNEIFELTIPALGDTVFRDIFFKYHNNECQLCHIKKEKGLSIDHIIATNDKNVKDNRLINLSCLCRKCNSQKNGHVGKILEEEQLNALRSQAASISRNLCLSFLTIYENKGNHRKMHKQSERNINNKYNFLSSRDIYNGLVGQKKQMLEFLISKKSLINPECTQPIYYEEAARHLSTSKGAISVIIKRVLETNLIYKHHTKVGRGGYGIYKYSPFIRELIHNM